MDKAWCHSQIKLGELVYDPYDRRGDEVKITGKRTQKKARAPVIQ